MTHDEITASMQMASDFKLLQYAVGIFTGIAAAMAAAIIYIYRDTRMERAEWRNELKQMNSQLQSLLNKNSEAFHESVLATRELRTAINSQEKAIERLEHTLVNHR